MGVSRSDPIERRRLALMRQTAGQTNKFSLGGQIKKGGHAPRPITLAGMALDLAKECAPIPGGGIKVRGTMGVGELREAFNSISQPAGITCTLALLDYERHNEVESQILLFRGTDAGGAPFEIKSDRLRGGVDVNQVAKETAQRLLDQGKPPT